MVIGSMRCTPLTVSANTADHCDTITLISVRSPRWVYATSVLMMRADDSQKRLHNQALHINCAPGLSLGTDLVSFLRCESKDKQETCAGKGESDATEHHNKDRGREEPPPLDADTVGVCGLVCGRSTATAAAGPRDHEAQPGLLPARCVSLGSA